MIEALIVAARRTAVAPRGGAFTGLESHELAAACIRAALADVGATAASIDDILLGNALGAGGNPARLAALAAGLPENVSALTLDSQCCAGLDAVALAAARIRSGEAEAILAGGVESWSRAPIRSRRPKASSEIPSAYDRPPFSPWPDRDPDMLEAAARLALDLDLTRAAQEAFAVESHAKARAAGPLAGLVSLNGCDRDAFTRALAPKTAARLPVLVGDAEHGLTAATVAVEADAAACLLVVSEARALALGARRALRVVASARVGGDPTQPGLVPISAARDVLTRTGLTVGDLAAVEIMEAFAVQAMAFVAALGIPAAIVNRAGGALSRGHPIGASGAILLAQLFDLLRPGERGLAAIAAAGGLGSVLLVECIAL